MVSRAFIEQVKVGLAAGGIALVLVSYVVTVLRQRVKDVPGVRATLDETVVFSIGRFRVNLVQFVCGVLLLFATMGTLNYMGYSHFSQRTQLDEYDLLHYYVAPKYFDELGYFNLLPALIIADAEAGRHCPDRTRRYLFQDADDYKINPIAHALAMKDAVKGRFSDDRWRQFSRDVLFLQRGVQPMGCKLWRQLLQDHGFNGTPVWLLVARPLTQLIPVTHLRWAVSLDVLWILGALVAVSWAFGPRTAAFAWIFLSISYSVRWPVIGWAFLRYDWVGSVVVGLALLKKQRYGASGAFFAYAALMRYFPVVWMLGIAAKGIHALLYNRQVPLRTFWRRIPGRYGRMAAGFLGVVLVLGTVSVAVDGWEVHRQSIQNISAHVKPHNLSSRRMGLAIAAVYRGETTQKWITDEKRQAVRDMEAPLRVLAIGLIVFLGVFLTRLTDWEAVGLGVIPFFWLTTSSYYYYVILVTAVIVHAKWIHKGMHVFGLLTLFALQLYLNAAEYLNPGMRYPTISTACVILTLYSFVILIVLGRQWMVSRHALSKTRDD